MRELEVVLRFTRHCLGNVGKVYWERGKEKSYFLMPRGPNGRVIFLPTWWQAVISKAAAVLGRHQQDVAEIKFSLEVVGEPRPIPQEFYFRYYASDRFARHEAFFPGDTIRLTCVVPATVPAEDFRQLLVIAGKYYGISPARPNEYGLFDVVQIRSLTAPKEEGEECTTA